MAVESDLITTISPSTNQPIISRSPLSAEQLAQLPVTATTAFQTYCSKYSLSERQKIVTKALQLIIARENDLARGLTEQMGRPIKYAEVEIRTAAKRAEYLLRISEDCLKDTEGEPEEGYKRYIKKLGVGVVLILFAWNVSIGSICYNEVAVRRLKALISILTSSSSTLSSQLSWLATQSLSSLLLRLRQLQKM